MPVRDADTFFQARRPDVAVLGNRGASGIDGVVSSAFGARAARPDRPLVLAIGDLSFFHDLNGLLAARRFGLGITVVMLQNDGGGIFSFLAQAGHGERFEELFGTPLGLDVAPAVRMHGGRHRRVATLAAFRRALRAGLGGPGLTVVEALCPARADNVVLHDRVVRAMGDAARAALGSGGSEG
jgi:2-succinyl-5-enolpyruvyl-6-hydroxy-3-cyclohexene-1-carboxylate synthase